MAKRSKVTTEDPSPGFPLRVGVADVGSNAIRFAAAEFIAPTTAAELFAERVPVRLGHGVFQTGRLDPAAFEAAVQTMVRFRDALDEHDVRHYRAVATSAVRESENGGELKAAARQRARIKLEVISGAEEARLVYWAARSRLPLNAGEPWVMADLGGGSLEVALVDGNGLLESESHTIGSVRLLEELEQASGLRAFRRLVDEYLEGLRIPELTARAGGFLATGGNMEDLAQLAGAGDDGVGIVPLKKLDEVIARLADLSVPERIEKLGLRDDRADVIVPAGLVYAHLARLVGVDRIHVPHVGLKDGIMLDLVERVTQQRGYAARHADEVRAGAVALGRRFGFDEGHGVQVARLADVLFAALGSLHGLDDEDREILVAAAILHDVGQRIGYQKHHKHSYYLISQSELPGLDAHDIELAANVARYHRKADPTPKHEPFAALDDEDQDRVTKLAAILRIADALDRQHLERVRKVEAAIENDAVVLRLEGRGDLGIERWSVARKSGLFAAAFGREVRIEPAEEKDDV